MSGQTGDLFPGTGVRAKIDTADSPLAERMRPLDIDGFAGQKDLMAEGAILRRMIEEDRLGSVIFWGPPGSGKTTLARIIAEKTGSFYMSYSAVTSGAREMKEVMNNARDIRRRSGMRTILFIDEVHRFNKAQQDAFLPFVESGDVILIGATTENPSFEINAALLSRSKVFVFKPLDDDDVTGLINRAVINDEELSGIDLKIDDDALRMILESSDGDARRALNTLEMAVLLSSGEDDGKRIVGFDEVKGAIQRKTPAYDKSGEEHYNIISALHKSIRGSDPDASLYWLARMLESGEDRRYLLRRLARVAVEDVGLADPGAIVQASSAKNAFDFMGEPEGDLVIAQLVIYLALAPKSNSVYRAYGDATRDVRNFKAYNVPLHIRNAPTSLMRELGYGKEYEYSHDMPEKISIHSFFPEELGEKRYYEPGEDGLEKEYGKRLKRFRETIKKIRALRKDEK